MKGLIAALAFLALPAAAWADDLDLPTRLSLDEPRDRGQDLEFERQRPDDSSSLTPMEFIYRHSELEAGMLYTDFDNSLGLQSNIAFYFRWGVEVVPNLSVHVTFRYCEFTNGPGSMPNREELRIQAFLFGASYHVPLSREFALVGGLGIGPRWWDSSSFQNETGVLISGALGAPARLWAM
ncbi:MAG: hypothetical protein EHM91_17330, partial [Planctomycetota bacterium]